MTNLSCSLLPHAPCSCVRQNISDQALSMISSNTVERQIRSDFVLRCNISIERARADEICASSKHGSRLALCPLLQACVLSLIRAQSRHVTICQRGASLLSMARLQAGTLMIGQWKYLPRHDLVHRARYTRRNPATSMCVNSIESYLTYASQSSPHISSTNDSVFQRESDNVRVLQCCAHGDPARESSICSSCP